LEGAQAVNTDAILKVLEDIAASITVQSGTDLRQGLEAAAESLLDRGMDSLDFIDYLLAIEGKFGYRVSEEDIKANGLTSTAKMAGFLDQIASKACK
jgi:acyl carrier protein